MSARADTPGAGPAPTPAELSDIPLLRDLDPGALDALVAAAELRDAPAGAGVYREGSPADGVWLVLDGTVTLRAVPRGDEDQAEIRTAVAGDSFGEEALVPGLSRRASADAGARGARLVAVPSAVLERVLARAGRDHAWRERALGRSVIRDALATSALTRGLPPDEREQLAAAARLARFERGAPLFEAGDPAECCYLVVDGLVQLVDEAQERPTIRAYLARGDLFGDHELVSRTPRALSAVAAGTSVCVQIPAAAFIALSDRHPALVERARRFREQAWAAQSERLGEAANATRHVFQDLYRMQMARSLLVIDQDTCVRCGHCAWSCAQTHDGVSRLIRRGDKLVARVAGPASARAGQPIGAAARSLLVPSSCQHCRHPACMVDCPTGAIGRDSDGEVFIREALCTGCASCAKACPWDNIHMAPRLPGSSSRGPSGPEVAAEDSSAPGQSTKVAVKCDLCRDYEAPACVQACPTESLLRLDPMRDVAELRHFLPAPAPSAANAAEPDRADDGPRSRSGRSSENSSPSALGRTSFAPVLGPLAGAAIALAGLGLALHERIVPGAGLGLACGLAGGLALLGLAGYGVLKRGVRLWMKPRRRVSAARREAGAEPQRPLPRSRLRPQLLIHDALGIVALACVLVHAGPRLPDSPAGALYLGFLIAAGLGLFGAVIYAVAPRRLSRLERRGALPEDLAGERAALIDRLYQVSSGADELVKALAARILVPYARAPLGWLALLASGRDLRAEQARVRARVSAILRGPAEAGADAARAGSAREDRAGPGLDEIIPVVVELRALGARRVLTALLRAWLPLHLVAAAVCLAMFALHLLMVLA